MSNPVRLLVGLGNPGTRYAGTRHNAGAAFVRALADARGGNLQRDSRFFGETGLIAIGAISLRLLIPNTYMNLSGKSVTAMAGYYRLCAAEMLVAHDELDIEPGQCRFKAGGGHGGHNGLRNIVESLGSSDFYRLRIGIGHPGKAGDVSEYVLSRAPAEERTRTQAAIAEALRILPDAIGGNWAIAMNRLHSFSA